MILFNNNGQSALEFIILTGVAIFFFLGFIYAVNYNIGERTEAKKNLMAKEIGLAIRDEINLASESLDGYYRQFEVPEELLGNEYDVNILDNFVFVRTTDGKHTASFKIQEVEGDIQKGTNIISRQDNVIYLNP